MNAFLDSRRTNMSCGFISDEEDFTLLKSLADDLGQAAVSGNLSQSIGFNVSSMGLIAPPPSSSDDSWKEVTAAPSKYPFSCTSSSAHGVSAAGGHGRGHQGRADGELRVQRQRPAADCGADRRRVCGSSVPAAQSHGCR